MRFYLIILFTICSIPILAQTIDYNKISAGIFYYPSISYRSLSSSFITEIRNENEQSIFGNGVELSIKYKLAKFIAFESGLQFQQRGFKTKEFIFDNANQDPLVPMRSRNIDTFNYLGIPLKVSFEKYYNSVSFSPAIGIIVNKFLDHKYTVITEFENDKRKEVIGNNEQYNSVLLTTNLSLEIAYHLSKKLDIALMPMFQYDMTSIIDASIKEYLWDLGLKFGFRYNL